MRDGYIPTVGMLAALTDARGADGMDYIRCRLRGLTDRNHWPTPAGRACIQREIARRRDLERGRHAQG